MTIRDHIREQEDFFHVPVAALPFDNSNEWVPAQYCESCEQLTTFSDSVEDWLTCDRCGAPADKQNIQMILQPERKPAGKVVPIRKEKRA